MANITKQKRDQMIEFLDRLKNEHSDDASVRAFNEIENHLKEKKFGLVFEEHTEAVDEYLEENIPVLTADNSRRLCKDIELPWNFLIEGDNLQALYLLEKTHRGKVDCIYIDPPYNNRNRSWKYNNDYVDDNDVYKHSKWLSMMKTRLVIAKRLLNPKDSVLIVTIDEKEYLHLGCLLEELFPEAKIQMISSVINHASVARFNEFNRNNEYIFFVMIGEYELQSIDNSKTAVEGAEVAWNTLRRHSPSNVRASRPRQFYPIYINIKTGKIEKIGEPITPDVDRNSVEQIRGCVAVFPVRDNGTEMLWGVIPSELERRLKGGYVRVGKYQPEKPQQFSIQVLPSGPIEKIEKGELKISGYREDGSVIVYHEDTKKVLPKSQWDYISHDAKTYGSNVLRDIFKGAPFDYPKSVYAVKDALSLFVSHKKDAIIVDFFAGSGTTGHAVNLLNAEDGGKRKFILVTNNEISDTEEKTLTAEGITEKDEKWDNLGVAKHVTWNRMKCVIEGINIEGEPLSGNYGVEQEIYVKSEDEGHKNCYIKKKEQVYPMLSERLKSDGFKCNIKFFKCDWTPRRPMDYLLSNALCLHIREMIELQNAIEIDNKENVLVLNKDDLKKYVINRDAKEIKHIWINQNIILNNEELRILKSIGYRFIPREFFGQELREAAE